MSTCCESCCEFPEKACTPNEEVTGTAIGEQEWAGIDKVLKSLTPEAQSALADLVSKLSS